MFLFTEGWAQHKMLEEMVQDADGGDRERVQALKAELAEVRAEHDRELEKLRRELAAKGVVSSNRDADSVAENLAVQQELDTLHRALREKDRTLDDLTRECRRLEDALEDRHLDFDALRNEIDRKDQSLLAAQERVARLEQGGGAQVAHPHPQPRQPQSRPGQTPSAPARAPESNIPSETPGDIDSMVESEMPPTSAMLPEPRPSASQFLGGLALGLVVATLAVTAVLFRLDASFGTLLSGPGAPSEWIEPDPAPGDDGGSTGRITHTPAEIVVGTARDSLADGQQGPLLVVLKDAVFTMGNRSGMPNSNTRPAHNVALTSFLMGAHEVTFEEYDRFVRATGGRFPNDFGWGRRRRPVVDVSFDDATAYAGWLSRQTGKHYRLPSEAEWEFAARGGARSQYWWGYAFETGRAVCADCGSAWDNRSTAPVASLVDNPFGLYDTAGNAAEWVADCYRSNYDGAPDTGVVWDAPNCAQRVVRGGSFANPHHTLRSYARHRERPGTRRDSLGFRVARDL